MHLWKHASIHVHDSYMFSECMHSNDVNTWRLSAELQTDRHIRNVFLFDQALHKQLSITYVYALIQATILHFFLTLACKPWFQVMWLQESVIGLTSGMACITSFYVMHTSMHVSVWLLCSCVRASSNKIISAYTYTRICTSVQQKLYCKAHVARLLAGSWFCFRGGIRWRHSTGTTVASQMSDRQQVFFPAKSDTLRTFACSPIQADSLFSRQDKLQDRRSGGDQASLASLN